MKLPSLQTLKQYVSQRSETFIGLFVVAVLIIGIAAITIAAESSKPKIVHEPTKACDLLTLTEAKELLGASTLQTTNTPPTQSGDITVSQCGFADGTPDKDNMVIAAVVVRSGINDKGVQQNITDFSGAQSQQSVEAVTGVGGSAFYSPELGQLNILKDRDWIILSFGVGSTPQANTLEDAVALAKKVI